MTDIFSALADSPGEVNFYFLRHGKSEGNDKDIVQGHLDFPLSSEGREQAGRTGAWFADKNIRTLLCSPLSRAAQTAAIVAEEAGLPKPRQLESLREMNTGAYTGLTLEEAREKYPDMWPRFQAASWEGVEGAEKIESLRERSTAVLAALVKEVAGYSGKAGILAVSHAGFLQWIIKSICGGTSWFPLFPMGHCGVYQLSVNGPIVRWSLLNFQVLGVTGKR